MNKQIHGGQSGGDTDMEKDGAGKWKRESLGQQVLFYTRELESSPLR